MSIDACKWHGACYGFRDEASQWQAPKVAVSSDLTARIGYDSMDASEYIDTPEVLKAKAAAFIRLFSSAKRCILFTGAGLSTGAGIADYASQASDSLSGVGGGVSTSPFLAQPTFAHRVLVAWCLAGKIYRWIQQNHDGLPQKAGLPQEFVNEIHGAWYSPDNPVIPMSGSLRTDLFEDMLHCAETADLSIAVGTSVCGLNADQVVTEPAARAARGTGSGAVIIGLQQTVHDAEATLRVFARCDDFFKVVAELQELKIPQALPGIKYWIPPCMQDKSDEELVFYGLPYDASGRRVPEGNLTLDLREDAQVVITNGIHAGACGEVHRFDAERNVDCRIKLKPENPKMKLRAFVALKLGRWWIQAAVDGAVPLLPIVNIPTQPTAANGGLLVQSSIETYAT